MNPHCRTLTVGRPSLNRQPCQSDWSVALAEALACWCRADEVQDTILAAVKVKGQARLVYLVKTISGERVMSNCIEGEQEPACYLFCHAPASLATNCAQQASAVCRAGTRIWVLRHSTQYCANSNLRPRRRLSLCACRGAPLARGRAAHLRQLYDAGPVAGCRTAAPTSHRLPRPGEAIAHNQDIPNSKRPSRQELTGPRLGICAPAAPLTAPTWGAPADGNRHPCLAPTSGPPLFHLCTLSSDSVMCICTGHPVEGGNGARPRRPARPRRHVR